MRTLDREKGGSASGSVDDLGDWIVVDRDGIGVVNIECGARSGRLGPISSDRCRKGYT